MAITMETGCAAHTLALTANGGGAGNPVVVTTGATGAVPNFAAGMAIADATADKALCFHNRIVA